jgi:archaetidylinositol phosphate synthase
MIDSVSEMLVFIGLGLSPYLRIDLALFALVCYLLASIYVYLVTYVNGVFRISYSGLGPTEMRLIAILANTVVFFTGNLTVTLPLVTLTFYDLVVIGVSLVILSLLTVSAITTAMSLSKEDRAAHREKVLKRRAARAAHLQALRDERAMRKATARAARLPKARLIIE